MIEPAPMPSWARDITIWLLAIAAAMIMASVAMFLLEAWLIVWDWLLRRLGDLGRAWRNE